MVIFSFKCIPLARKCDGTLDCDDGSDEDTEEKATCSKLQLNLDRWPYVAILILKLEISFQWTANCL